MPRGCILALLLLAIALSAAAQPDEQRTQGPPAALVITAAVQELQIRSPLNLVGTTRAAMTATVAAEVGGRVTSILIEEGERVEEGETLLRLRTLPLELELRETQATLAEVRARLKKARADVRRAEALYEQGFISEEELQTRQTDKAALLRQSERLVATRNRLQDRLERLAIKAPFTGRVVEKRTELGQWLDVGDAVVLLSDLSTIDIRVPVPERHVAKIERGEQAEVTLAALPGQTLAGEVTAVIPQADTTARTFPVDISLDNPQGLIMAGMLANVTFYVGAPRTALVVPKDALVPQPGGDAHLLKVEKGKAALVPVRTIGKQRDLYAVESLGPPLKKGDRVIVRGNERVRPGQPVRESDRQQR